MKFRIGEKELSKGNIMQLPIYVKMIRVLNGSYLDPVLRQRLPQNFGTQK